jgi:hypothetical protein
MGIKEKNIVSKKEKTTSISTKKENTIGLFSEKIGGTKQD